MVEELDPSRIMEIGTGFWASKALLSAVELELFTELGRDGATGAGLVHGLGTLEIGQRVVPPAGFEPALPPPEAGRIVTAGAF